MKGRSSLEDVYIVNKHNLVFKNDLSFLISPSNDVGLENVFFTSKSNSISSVVTFWQQRNENKSNIFKLTLLFKIK